MSEILAKLGLDSARFEKGLQSASAKFSGFARGISMQAGTAAETAGDTFSKKFSLKNQLTAAAVALGVSVENIAEKIAQAFTGGSQEAWKAGLSATEQAARIIEESTLARLSALRQIEALEKNIARNRANEDAAPKKTPSFLAAILGGASKFLFGSPLAPIAAAASHLLGKESEAEAFQRSQKATAGRLENEAKVTALKERQAKLDERIAAARKDLELAGASDTERMNALLDQAIDLQRKADEAARKGQESGELQLAAIQKFTAAKQLDLKIEKDIADAYERQARAVLDLGEKVRDAHTEMSGAQRALATQRRDALAFTLSQAAEGTRGTPRDRTRAREIMRLEEQARRMADSGSAVIQWDSVARKNVSRDAGHFQSAAAQLRQSMGGLQSSERDQFASAVSAWSKATASYEAASKALSAAMRPITPPK